VFHPQFTGEVPDPKFYDYAMIARSTENGIYFASVNYALENQKSTTSLLSPKGECLIKAKAEKQELLTYTIEPDEANRLLAQRLLSNLLL
jgi:ribosomal-protein-alanine N-acetyltransferase